MNPTSSYQSFLRTVLSSTPSPRYELIVQLLITVQEGPHRCCLNDLNLISGLQHTLATPSAVGSQTGWIHLQNLCSLIFNQQCFPPVFRVRACMHILWNSPSHRISVAVDRENTPFGISTITLWTHLEYRYERSRLKVTTLLDGRILIHVGICPA